MLIKRFGINESKVKVIYNGFLKKEENFIIKIARDIAINFVLVIWED